MKNFCLTSRAKTELLEFLESWATGTARAVTVWNYEMLEQLKSCQDILGDAFCEQIELPSGSTYGEAANRILWLLEHPYDA